MGAAGGIVTAERRVQNVLWKIQATRWETRVAFKLWACETLAARLAARENRADILAGMDLNRQTPAISSILIDLAQRQTMEQSAAFARLLGREARGHIPEKAMFHRMASLIVLKAPDMPSILFETGYISNPRDAAFLNSPAGRAQIAQSVARAVRIYFARRTQIR